MITNNDLNVEYESKITTLDDLKATGSKIKEDVDMFVNVGAKILVLAKYKGTVEELVIPSEIGWLDGDAFNKNKFLKSVYIPASVMNFGEYVFSNCPNLTYATYEEGCAFIPDYMFFSCKNLEKIFLPATIETICDNAFWGCYGLKEIVYNGTMAQWDKIEKGKEWNEGTEDFIVRCLDGEISA